MDLQNKTIIITGASSGIGEEAAKQLARLGASVCLIARRHEELQRVQRQIQDQGGEAWIYAADLTNDEQTKEAVDNILHDHAKVDVLINNAAHSIRRPITQALERVHDYERTMQINYIAPIRLTLSLLPHFLAQGHGQIINVSTMSTQVPIPLFSAYLGSKSALESFSRSLSMELGDKGIDVSIVYFPMVRTPMSSRTRIYKHMRMMDMETAAGWLVKAVLKKPYQVSSTSGAIANVFLNAAPAAMIRLARPVFRRMDERLSKKLKEN